MGMFGSGLIRIGRVIIISDVGIKGLVLRLYGIVSNCVGIVVRMLLVCVMIGCICWGVRGGTMGFRTLWTW